MLIEPIDAKLKARLALYGSTKLYGDFDKRRNMEQAGLIQLFDAAWEHALKDAINEAKVCDSKDAFRKLTDKERSFFDFEQEHREVHLLKDGLDFVAQLRRDSNGTLILTQLWQTHLAPNGNGSGQMRAKIIEGLDERKKAAKVWSEAYYKASLTSKRWYYIFGVPAAVMAIAAGSSSILKIEIALPYLSICVAALSALQTFFNFGGQSEKLQAAGAGWGGVARKIEQEENSLAILEPDDKALVSILDEITDLMNKQENSSSPLGIKLYAQSKERLSANSP